MQIKKKKLISYLPKIGLTTFVVVVINTPLAECTRLDDTEVETWTYGMIIYDLTQWVMVTFVFV
jgi:hypothetical protein